MSNHAPELLEGPRLFVSATEVHKLSTAEVMMRAAGGARIEGAPLRRPEPGIRVVGAMGVVYG